MHLRILLLPFPPFQRYLYSIIVLFIARYAGLGSGQPEVKPSTEIGRLKELTGKLGWMNGNLLWMPLTSVRGGGHIRHESTQTQLLKLSVM